MWNPGLNLGEKKYINGKSGEIRIKAMVWLRIL